MLSSIALLTALGATAIAKTVIITAGSGGLSFSPASSTAAVGDILEFHFVSSIHSAVQGDFSTPCSMGSLSTTGFDSGPVTSTDVFQVTVTSTDPIWFFCGTPTHCQGGMAGVVNPPSSGNTLATYMSNAAGTSSTSSVGKVQGGVVVKAGSGSSSSSAGPSTTSLTSTKSSTSTSQLSTPSSNSVSSKSSPSTTSSSSPSASPTRSASASSSPSGSSNVTTTPTFTPTAAGNSVLGTSKSAVVGLVVGLGFFFALMI